MRVPPVNHRYCGWRESVKIVPQVKTAVTDLSDLNTRLDTAHKIYDRDMPGLLESMVEGINTLQSARMLVEFMKEQFKES